MLTLKTPSDSKVAMVYGQMNEPPGNRLRVALTGLTMAEKFRDEGKDVLLFVDNIYRYTLGGNRSISTVGSYAFSGWATSLHWLKKWVSYKSVLRQLKPVLSHLSKRYMYLRMT